MCKLLLPIVTVGLAILLGGCKRNAQDTKWVYMPDMLDSTKHKAQGDFLMPPEGAVAMDAMLYPDTIEDSEKYLRNYLKNGSTVKEDTLEGKRLYGIYCVPCHGPEAKGDGKITDKFPKPPDLTHDNYKKRGDGFFFDRITKGSSVMPSYGHATSQKERWKIVLHLRELQGVSE